MSIHKEKYKYKFSIIEHTAVKKKKKTMCIFSISTIPVIKELQCFSKKLNFQILNKFDLSFFH